jgi:carbon monoxide dehydrogenase subunit G
VRASCYALGVIRLREHLDVDATPETAFAFVARVEDYPAWLPGVVRAEATDDGGIRLSLVGPGGIGVEALGRVLESDPPRSISIEATSGLFRIAATCTVEPLGEGRSRIGVEADVEPRGLAKLAAGSIEKELRAAIPDTLKQLRTSVEAAQARPAGR